MALAGTKCDVDNNKRKVSQKQGKSLAKKHNMVFAETSSKTGEGISNLFKALSEKIASTKKEWW